MKKFISIIAAAVCAATCTSFIACGSDDETEPETPSDVVTEEEWVAAFEIENFENVTVDRSYTLDGVSTNNSGYYGYAYYDADQYEKETQEYNWTSTAKIDVDYSEAEYTIGGNTYTSDVFTGNVYMESNLPYTYTWDYNLTDPDVIEEALGYVSDNYVELCANPSGTDSFNYSYEDYIQYEINDEYAYLYDLYLAEKETDNGVTGEWAYFIRYDTLDTFVFESNFSAAGNRLGVSVGGLANYYDEFTYDEEAGAYVYTYEEDARDSDTAFSISYSYADDNYIYTEVL